MEDGFGTSLARPGGNITSLSCLSAEALGVSLRIFDVGHPAALKSAFAAMPQEGAGVLLLMIRP